MKVQYYFESENSELCYSKKYFQNLMEYEGWTEIEVIKAIPEEVYPYFWCEHYGTYGERGIDFSCGISCKHYTPRNGKSGCCKHYSKKFYSHGEKIILKL
jgi:hypothetical protein